VRSERAPDALAFATRRERAACRIALRQLRQTDGASAPLERWLRELDASPAASGAGAH
jgi:hypothetical protein